LAALGDVGTPSVEISFDDGKTWHGTVVTGHHGHWKTTVNHPRGAGFVSLRASVADRNGNSEKVTIIRAYTLK
ncbi:MAG: hypothetical protein ACJ73U_35830, partial [Actinophytocola sp.]